MSEKLSIRPKSGLVVKNPVSGLALPWDRTTSVPSNQFWLRRLAAGDVESVWEKKVLESKPKAEKKAEKVSKKEKQDDEEFVL